MGELALKTYPRDQFNHVVAYDEGFGGYAVEAEIPFPQFFLNRTSKEALIEQHLKTQISAGVANKSSLSPPLHLLYLACKQCNEDFPNVCLEFLKCWHGHAGWLLAESTMLSTELNKVLANIPWNMISKDELKASLWLSTTFKHLDPLLNQGHDIFDLLEQQNWPLLPQLRSANETEPEEILTKLTQQFYALGSYLPEAGVVDVKNPLESGRMLSAFFRAYQLHLTTITPMFSSEDLTQWSVSSNFPLNQKIALETPLKIVYEKEKPLKKLEDNTPAVTLLVQNTQHTEIVSLGYDRFGQGMKWPILGGAHLVRFQPFFATIPYKIRLRQARQINYPNSGQPFSYEGDVVITDIREGSSVEKTLSMNRVHETWDGYRFYLANMTNSQDGVKRVQIVINHDPAKYWLTYPGALMVSLGILLLFWMKPYKKNKGHKKWITLI